MPDEKPVETSSAADFLQLALEHPQEAQEDDDDDPGAEASASESESPDAEASASEEDPEPDSEAEISDETADDDDDGEPRLDPLIEELAKGNPKAERRVREIAEGLQKLKSETKSLKNDLEAAKPKADTWETYEKALADPNLAGPILEQLLQAVAKHHGFGTEDLIPNLVEGWINGTGAEAPASGNAAWQRKGYSSAREMQMDQELKALRSSVAQFQHAHAELQKERTAAREQAEFKNHLDEVAPRTIRRLEKLENGWKVTKGMVEKALREFPQLHGDPVRAVKAAFADELKAHFAKSASRVKRGPEMLPETRGKGQEIKEPSRMTAADVYAML